jgi:hypothetical protein
MRRHLPTISLSEAPVAIKLSTNARTDEFHPLECTIHLMACKPWIDSLHGSVRLRICRSGLKQSAFEKLHSLTLVSFHLSVKPAQWKRRRLRGKQVKKKWQGLQAYFKSDC